MPCRQLRFDLFDLVLKPRIFLRLRGKQGSRKRRHSWVDRDTVEQWNDPALALGSNQPELCSITTDRVDQLRTGADQPIAYADQHERCLLLRSLDGHKAHRGSAHCFAQGFGISRIVFPALYIGLHQLRRDQLHFMAVRRQEPRQMVRRPTRLDSNHCWRQLLEKRHHLGTAQFFAQDGLLGGVDAMKLVNVL